MILICYVFYIVVFTLSTDKGCTNYVVLNAKSIIYQSTMGSERKVTGAKRKENDN